MIEWSHVAIYGTKVCLGKAERYEKSYKGVIDGTVARPSMKSAAHMSSGAHSPASLKCVGLRQDTAWIVRKMLSHG